WSLLKLFRLLFVARFLGFLIAKCKLTSLHCSSF
ncbi:unnamed protein product, partial [Brassica oleracea]